jgi:hypothetical protein
MAENSLEMFSADLCAGGGKLAPWCGRHQCHALQGGNDLQRDSYSVAIVARVGNVDKHDSTNICRSVLF